MNKTMIELAIQKLRERRAVEKYTAIMTRFRDRELDVSQDQDFRTSFNGFYRVQRRNSAWYDTYFSLMQRWRQRRCKPSFDEVLDCLFKSANRCEPSFSSKLVATLDPNQPVWDTHVLDYFGIERPRYTLRPELKLQEAKNVYRELEERFSTLLRSREGKLVLSLFNRLVQEYTDITAITDVKKVNFILWKIDRVPTTFLAERA